MAASKQTANIQLNQWVGTDPFRMADFNEDNQKIDAAFGAMPRIAAGTFTGNGTAEQMIALDFTPKAVLVFNAEGRTCLYAGTNYFYYGGLAVPGAPCRYAGTNRPVVSVEDGGFKVYYHADDKIYANRSNEKEYYIAFG